MSSCPQVSGMLKSQLPPLPALASLDDLSSLSPLGNLSSSLAAGASNARGDADNEFAAYNSGDEYDRPDDANVLSEREMAEVSEGQGIRILSDDTCLWRPEGESKLQMTIIYVIT